VYHATLGLRVIKKRRAFASRDRRTTVPCADLHFGFRVEVNVQRFRGGLVFKAHRLVYLAFRDRRTTVPCADLHFGFRVEEQLVHRNVKRFRGGPAATPCRALTYISGLGLWLRIRARVMEDQNLLFRV